MLFGKGELRRLVVSVLRVCGGVSCWVANVNPRSRRKEKASKTERHIDG
jgi:hypothetical protein